MKLYLVHFRSKDLNRIQNQGQFWHIFYTHAAVLIAQDEIETWTVHLAAPVKEDTSSWDPLESSGINISRPRRFSGPI